MPDNVSNYGGNFSTWLGVAFAVATLLFLGFFVMSVMRVNKLRDGEGEALDAARRSAMRNAALSGLLLLVAVVFFYFGFGPGKPTVLTPPSEDGMRKLTEQMPDEKPVEQIKEEAAAKKPDVLQRQDEGFEKEAEEADAYLKKALERAEENNR